MRSRSGKVSGRLFLACALLLSVGLSAPAHGQGALLGVRYGSDGFSMSDVRAMESWMGKKFAVAVMFTNWCNASSVMDPLFTSQLPNIWNSGNVPIITWEVTLCSSTPYDVEYRAANGEYDVYLNAWADRLKTFLSGTDGMFGTADDRRVFVRLGHEMNGDWYPWSATGPGETPAGFIAMWKHVRALFLAKQLDNSHVQWMW